MSLTTTTLTRGAGLSAVAAGLLFIGVQVNHPPVDLALVTTAEWTVRQSMKVAISVLALAGITGLYLSQVRKAGVLGLLGYLVFAAGYLLMLTVEVTGLVVLPAIAGSSPGYVGDVLAVATGGRAVGSIGLLQPLNLLVGICYMGGGLMFGIALFRAHVLARWAAALLAVATTLTAAIPLLPQVNQRLFAVPTGIALVGLGWSLWRTHGVRAEASASETLAAPRTPAVAR